MKLYPSTLALPELASLPESERRSICAAADRAVHQFAVKQRMVGMGLWITLCIVGLLIGKPYGFWGGFVGGALGSALGGLVHHQLLVRAAVPYIKATLRRQSNPPYSDTVESR